MPVALRSPRQRSFEDLGTPLAETTFCVFDLETTGGSPAGSRITEFGAVKVRGGEVLAEFQTLVDPEMPIPPFITSLTGITDSMVSTAPPIESVLPAFLEFAGDAVLVAHNASFDTRFLAAVAERFGYERPGNPVVCTVRLARRLVRDEVRDLRLATLARAMRARHEPSHRALADARAACDVFHALLQLAGRWGVTHLDDLIWFQGIRGHPHFPKTRLADGLPRSRGVYLFAGEGDQILYVGKAANVRDRVRSYFGSDDRRRIGDLVREMQRVDSIECATDLDASVLEARLIRLHRPPFNRAQRGRARAVFVTLTRDRYPRLSVARSPGGLGPLPAGAADAVREALEDAGGIRTCTARIGAKTRFPGCILGQIGRCPAPCERDVEPERYAAGLAPIRAAIAGDPAGALDALERRIAQLAAAQRFEEAAATRDRLALLVDAVSRFRSAESVRRAGRIRIRCDGVELEIRDGVLSAVAGASLPIEPDGHPDEPRLIASWLWRHARRIAVIDSEHPLAVPLDGGAAIAGWAGRLARYRKGASAA